MKQNKRKSMSAKKRKTVSVLISVIILIIAGIVSEVYLRVYQPVVSSDGNIHSQLSVHFIDVGQGDCTLIKSEWGNILIDAGENGYEDTVISYLKSQGIVELNYVIATHPHSDHIGGIAEVLDEFIVGELIMPKIAEENTPATVTYEKMLRSAAASDAKIVAAKAGRDYLMGEVYFQLLSPYEQDENMNNMSVGVRVTYDGYSFLFTGDAETQVEERILSEGYKIEADVFKAAHHGSSTSNSPEFISAVSPDYVIISCGENNSYGHPHEEVVQLFKKMHIPYYSTADYGTMIFAVKDSELLFYTADDIREENAA